MLAVKGYYDGSCVQLLEPLSLKKNTNVIITILDVDKYAEKPLGKDNAYGDIESRRAAFREIIEMREKSPFPKDFDYDKAREEAMIQKYGSFD